MDGRFETYIRDRRGFAAVPTHDDLTMVIVGWPYAEFAENRKDIEGNYLKAIALAPAFADRLRGARREARFAGAAVPNFFRKPYGPGWALVGDAGYNRDFITGQGMMDAFLDAELCAAALDGALSGTLPFDAAMDALPGATRDARVKAMYDFTCELATLEPPPPELQALLAAASRQPGGDGRLRADERRDHLPRRVLRAGERRCHHGRRLGRHVNGRQPGLPPGWRPRIHPIIPEARPDCAACAISTLSSSRSTRRRGSAPSSPGRARR